MFGLLTISAQVFLAFLVNIIFLSEAAYVSYTSESLRTRYVIYLMGYALAIGLIARGRWGVSKNFGTILTLFALMFLSVLISASFLQGSLSDNNLITKVYAAIIVPLCFALIGLVIARSPGSTFYVASFLSLIFCVLYSTWITYSGIAGGEVYSSVFYRHEDEYLLDTHYYADYFVSIGLIFWGERRRFAGWFLLLALLGAIVLGSRTSFVIAVSSTALYFLYYIFANGKIDRRLVAYAAVFLALSPLLGGFLLQGEGAIEIFDRTFRAENYSQTYVGRLEILEENLSKYSPECFPMGCFPYEDVLVGGKGSYVHNWISFFLSFGIFSTLLFMFLLHKAARKTWSSAAAIRRFLPVFSFLILVIFLSRSYIWAFWALILTYILSAPAPRVELRAQSSLAPVEIP